MLNEDFREMLSALSAEEVEYLLVDAYALAAHGLPRATGDMDVWVRCSEEIAERAWRALRKWGLNFVIEDYLPRKLKEREKHLL